MWRGIFGFGFLSWLDRQKALREYRTMRKREQEVLAFDRNNPLNLARLAVSVHDLPEAARRWEQAKASYPDFVRASPDSVSILLALKRFEEAEQLVLECKRLFPKDPRHAGGYAKVAHRRGDLPEAIRRWADFRRRYPMNPEGYIDGSTCLREAGMHDDAEALITRALAIEFDPQLIRIEWARIADARKDWEESLRRWTWIADHLKHGIGVAGAAHALKELGRFDEALALLDANAYAYRGDGSFSETYAAFHAQAKDR